MERSNSLGRDGQRLNGQAAQLLDLINDVDAAPTMQVVRAVGNLERALADLTRRRK
jgi:hypothetical protein